MKVRRSATRAKRAARAPSPFFSKDGAEGSAESFFPKKREAVNNLPHSGGTPLSADTQHQMEGAFGKGLEKVRIHTDEKAADASSALHAKAFTFGNHIYFNRGQYNPYSPEGKQLLAHELTHTLQQGGTQSAVGSVQHITNSPQIAKQGLLTPAQESAAIAFNNSRYDESSKRIIQDIAGVTRDASIGSATVEAIAAFQNTNGLVADGMVGQNTLDRMILNRLGANFPEHAIHLIVDFFNISTPDVLTISFDPGVGLLGFANTSFEPGGLRVIRLGPLAFLSAGIMRTVINGQLAVPRPAVAPLTPQPTHLTAVQETAAIQFNRDRYQDKRAVKAIQGIVGAAHDGILGRDTAERIAEFQSLNGLVPDGKAGEQTLRVMVAQLTAANQQNTVIRLIIDFYNISEHNSLLDIRFDASVTDNAVTTGPIPGPSLVLVGPPGFAQGFEGLVHTIAHELEHVRQNRAGIADIPISEFLGESVEILSIGMPEENDAGFFNDAARAISNWNLMTLPQRTAELNRFFQVRNKVRQRFNAVAVASRTANMQKIVNDFNAAPAP